MELDDERGHKISGRIAHLWFVRVGLAEPTVLAQSLSNFCRDFPRRETNSISPSYVSTVRDVFAELTKRFTYQQIEAIALESSTRASASNEHCGSFVIPHTQDEVAMRLRSRDPAVDLALGVVDRVLARVVRSRSSKIQNDVIVLHHQGLSVRVLTELQALREKTADTVTVALLNSIRLTLQAIARGLVQTPRAAEQRRVIHILTGDGINTNAAAARRMFHALRTEYKGSASPIRYFFLVFVCNSHTANLAVQVAIVGDWISKPIDNCDLVGTCVRWFKYLLHDYAEDFALSLKLYIHDHLRTVSTATRAADQKQTADWHILYGPDVLPSEVVDFFDGGISSMEHILKGSEGRALACHKAFLLLNKFLLKVEEKPTPTRFWLFAKCVWALLLLHLLGIGQLAFQAVGVDPGVENSKRMTRFGRWFTTSSAAQQLRRAALCLRLTIRAVSISSQKTTESSHRASILVRLGQAEVQRKVSADLSEHLRHLPLDPILDQELAVPQLFLTAGHLCMRYEAFKLYPTALWTLTSKFNPEGYIAAIESFLAMDFPQLDVGYSAELQYDARACENYAESIRYMVSSQVQTELVEILEEAKACSLDVEREHFLAKKAEGRRGVRLTTVGRSSRNNILRIYRGSRNLHIAKTLEERNVAMKLRFMNIWALAVQTNPEWFARGRGSLHWEQNVSLREMQALTFAGDHAKLRQFVENNKDDLREEARKLRETAQRTLEEAEHPIPFSNAEWLAWMTDHEVEFRECMQQATVTRRSYSERVSASSPLHGVPRLQVKPEKSQSLRGCGS